MLPWTCITPFGRPVVPLEYNQKADDESDVSANAISASSVWSAQAWTCTPDPVSEMALASPQTTTWRSSGDAATMSATVDPNVSDTASAVAAESATIAPSAPPLSIVDSGTATMPDRIAPR